MLKTKLVFSKKLPAHAKFSNESVLLFDEVLLIQPFFRKWSRQFHYKIALKSGENLKTLKEFQEVAEKISGMSIPQTKELTFIAVGGGSVGDFVGFLASVYLRGRDLIHIPSTWLAAVDSAHGGKNGLNLMGKKNQLGTFFNPKTTYLVEELLDTQPPVRMTDAMGEVIKIGLIGSKPIFHLVTTTKNFNLYKLLPKLIRLKLDIVQKDPFESNGYRRLLNLGHTMGHVFEMYCKWSHGVSVWAGLIFSLRFSHQRHLISDKDFIEIWNGLHQLGFTRNYQDALNKLSDQQVKDGLSKDKKMTKLNKIDFIFIRGIEKVERQTVSIQELLKEFDRQKREI